jgi:hypothetical protein
LASSVPTPQRLRKSNLFRVFKNDLIQAIDDMGWTKNRSRSTKQEQEELRGEVRASCLLPLLVIHAILGPA